MEGLQSRQGRSGILLLMTLIVSTCTGGDEEAGELSTFAEDVSVFGRVLENSTACDVDGICYLRIEFADTSIAALYGLGERAESPCEIARAVSDAAFRVDPGSMVTATLSLCGAEGYHLREIGEIGER